MQRNAQVVSAASWKNSGNQCVDNRRRNSTVHLSCTEGRRAGRYPKQTSWLPSWMISSRDGWRVVTWPQQQQDRLEATLHDVERDARERYRRHGGPLGISEPSSCADYPVVASGRPVSHRGGTTLCGRELCEPISSTGGILHTTEKRDVPRAQTRVRGSLALTHSARWFWRAGGCCMFDGLICSLQRVRERGRKDRVKSGYAKRGAIPG